MGLGASRHKVPKKPIPPRNALHLNLVREDRKRERKEGGRGRKVHRLTRGSIRLAVVATKYQYLSPLTHQPPNPAAVCTRLLAHLSTATGTGAWAQNQDEGREGGGEEGEGEEGRGRGEREEATSNGRNREVTFFVSPGTFPVCRGVVPYNRVPSKTLPPWLAHVLIR